MDILTVLSIFCGLLVLLAHALLFALLKSNNRIVETNKQLLILVAGREGKPEQAGATMRALVASAKPPQGKLKGIADGKKEDKKPTNTDYQMTIGV